MLRYLNIVICLTIPFIFVRCSIPNLSVQKIDNKIIEQKRQDTMEMCLMFTAENDKISKNVISKHRHTKNMGKGRRRVKRNIETATFGNPALNLDDAKRVENIVDKFYEDIEANGERVTYRQRNLDTLTTVKEDNKPNNTMRRFNFAPAVLLGPLPTREPFRLEDEKAPGIEWHKKWKHGIVPYFIDPKTYDAQLAEIITSAFDYVERHTCIRLQKLRDRPTDKDSLRKVEWLYITNPSGIRQCVHSNERKVNKGVQMVVFGYDCMSQGEIVHEVMHILGFSHEHTRPDRDQFVSIVWSNIKPGYKKYFEMREHDVLLGIPYDYSSVLHYPPRAFSKNGQITVLGQPGAKIGQRDGFSGTDIEKVGLIFGSECVDRNRQYLLKTCPRVVRSNFAPKNISITDIIEYFENRLWPFGIINFKIRDKLEFSAEERENIKAVIHHIEKETCIEFRDLTDEENGDGADDLTDEADGEAAKNSDSDSESAKKPKSSSSDNNNISKQKPLSTDEKSKTVKQVSSKESQSDANALKPSASDQAPEKASELSEQTPKQNVILDDTKHQENTSDNEIQKTDDNNEPKQETTDNEKLLRHGNATPKNQNKTTSSNTSLRRHAGNIVILARSPKPGCACPPSGRPNGNQVLEISADCFNSVNDLLHLFGHMLGLDHQHNMHDRDDYLHILWDNLTPEIKEEMNEKLPPAASVGFQYDYQSVMHYPWLQIKDGVTNIMYPIWNDGWAMGHWQGLSSMDVQKLNLLYYSQCEERKKQSQKSL